MSTTVMDSVSAQLSFLGLDDATLRAHSDEVEIDRFDYWTGGGSGGVRTCHCTATFRTDPQDERAA